MHISFGRVEDEIKAALGVEPAIKAVEVDVKNGDAVAALETAEKTAATIGAAAGQPEVVAGATVALTVTQDAAPVIQVLAPEIGAILSRLFHHGRAVGHAEAAAGLDHVADATASPAAQ